MISPLTITLPNQQNTLSRFLSACQSNPRILAAVLYGSHARGAADEWSDLDIGVVVADEDYDDFAAGREAFLRQLGEPLFIEDFGSEGILFFILADGTEGELSYDRAGDLTEPHGPWRALLDKGGVLAQAKPRPQPDPAAQVEALRQQVTWFWHDLSHFITAMGRGQLWWAAGQLEVLRRTCVNLARLRHDFNDQEVGDDPWFKLDKTLPEEALAPLRATFVPLERAAMLGAARVILDTYRGLAVPLGEERGVRYPTELERLMLGRLERLG
jgi:predicted nucleotidyltransferase